MLHLSYGQLVIAVEGDPAPLAWLREFLGAAFGDASPSAPPHQTVRLVLGPLPPDAGGPSQVTECFSLDGDFVRLPARREANGTLTLRDDDAQVQYVLRGGDATILAPADSKATRLGLLRVVREIATAHALALGHLHVHGGALDLAPGILVIAGPRRSGKTTLLLHGLLEGAGRYVSNDRILVDLSAKPPSVRGMPTIVTLRDETLARFPAFTERLRNSAYAQDRTLKEAETASGSRPNLSPIQLVALAGAAAAAEGPLRAVLFPAVAPEVGSFALRRLDGEEAAARLRQGLFLSTLPERPAAAFATGAQPRDGAALDRLCRDLAPRTPCLDLRLGARAYDGSAVWDAIREQLR